MSNMQIIWHGLPSTSIIHDSNDWDADVSPLFDSRRTNAITMTRSGGNLPTIKINHGGAAVTAVALVDVACSTGVVPTTKIWAYEPSTGAIRTSETMPAPSTAYAVDMTRVIAVHTWDQEWTDNGMILQWDIPDGESITIGRIIVGNWWHPNYNIGFGWKTTPTDPSTIMRSIGGQRWTDARDTYMQISASLKYLDEDEAYGDILPISMLAARDPCVLSVSPGTALSSVLDLYGYMSPVAVTHAGPGRFDANINFEEAL